MSSAKYIALDTETGGVNPKTTTLLSIYLIALDENLAQVGEPFEAKLADKSGVYRLTKGAMQVNKIDITNHEGVHPDKVRVHLAEWLSQHALGAKLTPIGHNIQFDLGYIFEQLMPQEEWEKYVSYRTIDISATANFLKFVGKIPAMQNTSLQGLSEYFKLSWTGDAHSAEVDTLMTVEILHAMKMLMSGESNG